MFRSRGKCLDYLVDMVFGRAENLGVKVVDQGAEPCLNGDGDLVFPEMTRKQVRDQLGSGMDFGLALKTSCLLGSLNVDDQVSVGIRKVEVE